MVDDGDFNVVHRDVARIALPVLAGGAKEVEVLSSVSPDGSLDEEPVIAASVFDLAFAAEHTALEIAVVDALSLACLACVLEQGLHAVKEFPVDQGWVASACRAGLAHQTGRPKRFNGRLEHLRGSALSFRNLTHYVARSPLEAGGFRPA